VQGRTDFDVTTSQMQIKVISRELIATPQIIVFTLNNCNTTETIVLTQLSCNTFSILLGYNVDCATGPSDVKMDPARVPRNRLMEVESENLSIY